MDALLKKIIELDRQAQQRIDSALEKKSDILNDVEKKRMELISELNNESEKKLRHVSETENAYADQKIAAIRSKSNNIIKNLEDAYDKNHVKWENTLYDRVFDKDV